MWRVSKVDAVGCHQCGVCRRSARRAEKRGKRRAMRQKQCRRKRAPSRPFSPATRHLAAPALIEHMHTLIIVKPYLGRASEHHLPGHRVGRTRAPAPIATRPVPQSIGRCLSGHADGSRVALPHAPLPDLTAVTQWLPLDYCGTRSSKYIHGLRRKRRLF